jgi:hypothetical protein
MTSKYLVAVLAFLCFLSAGISQSVNPGGGVYAISDIPGLRPELDLTLTNAVKGADTGSPTGNVSKVGRQAIIQFPSIPSTLYITTNSIHGTVYIDPSGVTPIDYLFTFPNVPFITLTPVGTNISELLTPVILTVTTTGATFAVVSSGAIVTNAYRVDWQANDGAGLSWSGQSLAAFGGATNIYQCNGSNAMSVFYFPVGSGANKWLVCNAYGYGSWQDKTIANLTDGADVFKKDGTVLPTADIDMGGYKLKNATKIQVTDGAGAGRVLLSDASGYGSWSIWPSWSPAVSPLNMNGNAISAVGTLGVNGAATFNGSAAHYGALTLVKATGSYASPDFYVLGYSRYEGVANFRNKVSVNGTGGTYGSPDFYTTGYNRFDGVADFRGVAYANHGIVAYANTTYANVGIYGANGSHIVTEGDIVVGDAGYLSAMVPTLGAPYGNIIAQRGMYAGGTKSFRIQHPRDPGKYLFHAAIESPRVELLYRGKTMLVGGKASINLNAYYGLIPHTLDAMLTNLTVNVYNNAGWTKVRCVKVNSSVDFDIEAETTTCNDTVEWIAIGTRCDPGVADYRMEANK